MLKTRFIKFTVANLVGKNKYLAYVGNLCFRMTLSSAGRNISETLSEFKLDYKLLQLRHVLTSR